MTNLNNLPQKRQWYKKWWGISLLIFILVVIGLAGWFIYLYIDIFTKLYQGEYDSRLLNVQAGPKYEMSQVIDPTDPYLGNVNADIKIVEFGDFLCPICQKSYSVMHELAIKNPDQVVIYWRNLPSVAEESVVLAHASECAHLQDKFWAYHDKLFQQQGLVNQNNLSIIAQQIGLNESFFQSCLDNKKMFYKIQADYDLTEQLEISGTPTFIVNGYKIQGYMPLEVWEEIIAKIVKDQGSSIKE